MKPKDLQNIDELFREGLNPEFAPVSFNSDDWQKLEVRLKKHSLRKSIVFWLKPLGSIAALLVLAFGIWQLWPSQQQPIAEQLKQEQSPAEEEEIPTPPATEKELVDSLIQPGINYPDFASRTETEVQEDRPSTKTQGSTESTDTSELISYSELIQRESISGELLRAERPNTSTLESITKKKEAPFVRQATDKPLHLDSGPKDRPLALSVLVAPAYNGVDNLNDGSFGGDIGLLLSWNLTPKWQFSTGAVYAKKVYETGLNNYKVETTYATQMVNADCRVLDIPFNIHYAILTKGKTTVSLGTGISSYLMLKEDYYFENSNGYGQNTEDVHLVNENQHWLSVLNLQMSVQQQISSRVSVNLQPFLKIPTQDIGYAKVRLQSFGMALSASWSL